MVLQKSIIPFDNSILDFTIMISEWEIPNKIDQVMEVWNIIPILNRQFLSISNESKSNGSNNGFMEIKKFGFLLL